MKWIKAVRTIQARHDREAERQIAGYQSGLWFVYQRTIRDCWYLHHVPSDMSALYYRTRAGARRAAERLNALAGDWDTPKPDAALLMAAAKICRQVQDEDRMPRCKLWLRAAQATGAAQ